MLTGFLEIQECSGARTQNLEIISCLKALSRLNKTGHGLQAKMFKILFRFVKKIVLSH
jgi:hypothetical protein